VFYRDVTRGLTYRLALNGEVSRYTTDAGHVHAQAFGPDGRLYTIGQGGITAYTANGTATLIAGHIRGNDIAVAS
jgi:gluconolactonase